MKKKLINYDTDVRIRLSSKDKNVLKRIAKEENKTTSGMIRYWIHNYKNFLKTWQP